jgi:hypothetical protein
MERGIHHPAGGKAELDSSSRIPAFSTYAV